MAVHVKCMDLFIYLLLYVSEETGGKKTNVSEWKGGKVGVLV